MIKVAEKLIKKYSTLDKEQRVIVSLLVNGILFILFYVWASKESYDGEAFRLNDTGLIWIIYILIVGCYFFYFKITGKEPKKDINTTFTQEEVALKKEHIEPVATFIASEEIKEKFASLLAHSTETLYRQNGNAQKNVKPIITFNFSFKEEDVLNYDDYSILLGLRSYISTFANFTFNDLKKWKDVIDFSALRENKNVQINDTVLALFGELHDGGDDFLKSPDKVSWDNLFYEKEVKKLSFDDTIEILVNLFSPVKSNKSHSLENADDDLPF